MDCLTTLHHHATDSEYTTDSEDDNDSEYTTDSEDDNDSEHATDSGDNHDSEHITDSEDDGDTYARLYTPVLAPGKYRPLTAPEIFAIAQDDSPIPTVTEDDRYVLGHSPDNWRDVKAFLQALRLRFGPHMHPLTEDMARQFVNQPVYHLDYSAINHAFFPGHNPRRKPTRRNLLQELKVGLLNPPYGKVRFLQPRDGVALRYAYCFIEDLPYRLVSRSRVLPSPLSRPPGFSTPPQWFFEPYGEFPPDIYMIDRSGLVIDRHSTMPLVVFAEKLD